MFLVSQGEGRKGDLSYFIEEAVRAYLLEQAVEQAKIATGTMQEDEINTLIGGLFWIR